MTAQLKKEAWNNIRYQLPISSCNQYFFVSDTIYLYCLAAQLSLPLLLRNTTTCRCCLYARQIISATILFTISLSLRPIQKVSVIIRDREKCLGIFWKVNPESWQNFSFGNCILCICSSYFLTNSWWILPQMWLVAYPPFQEAVKNKLNNEQHNYKPYFSCICSTGIFMLFFSSQNPITTIAGLNRNHRTKSLEDTFSLKCWSETQREYQWHIKAHFPQPTAAAW